MGRHGDDPEDAAAEAIRTAGGTLRDLRVAEVIEQDIHLDEGGAITYRTKLQLSFNRFLCEESRPFRAGRNRISRR